MTSWETKLPFFRHFFDTFSTAGKQAELFLLGFAVLFGLGLSSVPGAEGEIDIALLMNRLAVVDQEIDDALVDADRRQGHLPPVNRAQYLSSLLAPDTGSQLRVGGDLQVFYSRSRSNFTTPSGGVFPSGGSGKSDLTAFALTRDRLNLDLESGNRFHAFIEFNLSGDSQRRPLYALHNDHGVYQQQRQENFLGETYLEFRKNGHSGAGFRIGRLDLPFGLAVKPDLFPDSYLDAPDLLASDLLAPFGSTASPRLPHAARSEEPVMAVEASYDLRDIVRFSAALFQEERRILGWANSTGWDFHSADPGFRSFQVSAGVSPLEGWELSLAFRNRHDRGRGVAYWTDSPFREDFRSALATGQSDPAWDPSREEWSDQGGGAAFGSRSNEQAFYAGLALEIPLTGIALFAEYAHGWNQGFNQHINSDSLNTGLSYRLFPRLTLHLQHEWLRVKDASHLVDTGLGAWARDTHRHSLHRYLLALEYELYTGLWLEAGWQHEDWRDLSSLTRLKRRLASNLFYLGTRFTF